MKLKFLVVMLLLLLAPSSYSKESEESILGYVDSIAFWMHMPEGWYQDSSIAKKYGAIFFLIPKGYEFNQAPVVIYASAYKEKGLTEAMRHDAESFKAQDPKIKISVPKIIKSDKGKAIRMRIFESQLLRNQPFEAIAYIEEKGVTITVVASALSKNNFDISLPYFIKMLQSYALSELKVEIK